MAQGNQFERKPGRPGSLWVMALAAGLLALRSRHQHSQATVGRAAMPPPPGAGLASTPPAPKTGPRWKATLLRVYEDISRHRLMTMAAGVTFYAVLSIFPAIAAIVAIYGLFADASTIATHLQSLSGVLPEGAMNVVGDQLKRLTAQGSGTLGLASVLALLVSLWSANSGTKGMFDALNAAYGEDETRSFLRLTAISMIFTLAAIAFVLVALGLMVVVPPVLKALGLGGATALLVKVLRWPVLVLVVALLLAPLYRYGPSRASAQWRWISWGSAVAALGWLAVSLLFTWYAANFGTFNKTYGTLGAVMGFMMWIWLSTLVILIGAEVDAELERRTTTRLP